MIRLSKEYVLYKPLRPQGRARVCCPASNRYAEVWGDTVQMPEANERTSSPFLI